MKRIVLLSDTHSYLDPKIIKYLKDADEIWHAGDIGDIVITDELSKHKPLKGVYGNIDGGILRTVFPKDLIFECEQVKVYITHIGGYPNRYNLEAKAIIEKEKPLLFICGHSHILKVMFDKKYNLLHINPGAAGKHGFHHIQTIVRFNINGDKIENLEVIELGKRNELIE